MEKQTYESIKFDCIQKLQSTRKITIAALILILPIFLYVIKLPNYVFIFVFSIVEIQLAIALILQRRRISIVRNGEMFEFEIIGSLSGSGLSTRGFRVYHPIVVDPVTKIQVEVKNKANYYPYVKGGKIIGFKLGKRYWFHPELENIAVHSAFIEKPEPPNGHAG